MVRFKPCGCSPSRVARVHRSAWMRLLFPQRALYHCSNCGRKILATPAIQAQLGIRTFAEGRTQ